MKINCDLGEGLGLWQMGQDEHIMPYIDMANIACGFHASDPVTIGTTLDLAKQHNLTIGAHPSYPDLVGFGRRSMQLSKLELIKTIQYQVSALFGMSQIHGLQMSYVKPHGALYNDMMKNVEIFESICQAIKEIPHKLTLVIQALPDNQAFIDLANKYQISLQFEAFMDRHYQDNGLLVPRTNANSSINELDLIKHRSQQLKTKGTIQSLNGVELDMKIDTLCIHGDHPLAIEIAKTVRQELNA